MLVLGAVLVLTNLERTLRAATGTMRWRIKFVVVGLGLLFCVRIYTATQCLLYSAIDASWLVLDAGALLVCLLLVLRSLPRARLLHVAVYPSQTVLYHSITVTAAGIYLLAVGLFARLATHFGVTRGFAFNAFVLLLATVGLTVLLLSDRARQAPAPIRPCIQALKNSADPPAKPMPNRVPACFAVIGLSPVTSGASPTSIRMNP